MQNEEKSVLQRSVTRAGSVGLDDEALDVPFSRCIRRVLDEPPDLVCPEVGHEHFFTVLQGHVRVRNGRGEVDRTGGAKVQGVGGRGDDLTCAGVVVHDGHLAGGERCRECGCISSGADGRYRAA